MFLGFITKNTKENMLVFPNAKINIGLNIVAGRPDGYHDISSVFYPIGWSDVLELIPADTFRFTCSGIDIPGKTDENICTKAFHLVKTQYDIPNVHIHLHKIIPIGAGLGGGSADGAFTIRLLDTYYALNMSVETMEKLAGQLGSDCPFFISNKACYVTGTGDVFKQSTVSLSGKYIILIYPNIHIATAVAYSRVTPRKPEYEPEQSISRPIRDWKKLIKNDFQPGISGQYPIIGQLIEDLYEKGASFAAMTGSGSTVYGIFDRKPIVEVPKGFMVWQEKLP